MIHVITGVMSYHLIITKASLAQLFRRFSNLKYKSWLLHFTAGESLDLLRDDFESVVAAVEAYARFSAKLMRSETMTPFYFPDINDYERAMQQ